MCSYKKLRFFHADVLRKTILFLILLTFITRLGYAAYLNLAWDSNYDEDLAGYKLYHGTSPGDYEPPIDVGNTTAYELTGLNEGTTYYLSLTAYDISQNESEKTDEVYATTAIPEICTDGNDNDGDGLTDCADDDCDGIVGSETTCGVGECAGNAGNLICQDGGQVDTCDPFDGAEPEDCSDGFDNDCDGLTDCDDSACTGPPCDETTVYEDAEDGTTDRWYIYDDSPEGAEIRTVFDDDRQSYVIQFSGSGADNGYRLTEDDGSRWHNSSQFVVEWSMNYSEFFSVYIDLNTTAGHRYLQYRPYDYNNLGDEQYIKYGLGTNAMDGQWHTFVRDLQADLEGAQPGVTILEVNGFLIRGSGMVDDIGLLNDVPNYPITYEDAEDGLADRWYVYDNTPAGAQVYNVYDSDRQSNVIELSGSGADNGYRLTEDDGSRWHNSSQFVVEWSMNYSEFFSVYIDLNTTAGHRYLQYRPYDYNNLGDEQYIKYGLGTNAMDGQWHTFVRDLQADLEGAQPGVTILEVNGFLIRGSGMVDDITLHTYLPF